MNAEVRELKEQIALLQQQVSELKGWISDNVKGMPS
tara:strand:+ start:4570 stop:4677 length:108 start_codon:yes stop_codon:yes gene_type:complete